MSELLNMLTRLSQELRLLTTCLGLFHRSLGQAAGQGLLNSRQARQRLNICQRTLQNYRDRGVLPHTRLHGKIYYRAQDLERLMKKD